MTPAAPTDASWQFWIDRGGTFTDIIGRDPSGRIHALKVLSSTAEADGDAVISGLRRCLALGPDSRLPIEAIASVKIGTTVATNALLERRGAPTVLVITRGFEDQLEIGTQARPDIFARKVVKASLLYAQVAGAIERVRADGVVEIPLDLAALEISLRNARQRGMTACAIVFMHAYAFPDHERQAAALARALGFSQVSTSHDIAPLIRIVDRGDTTVADAYLTSVLNRYTTAVAAQLAGDGRLRPAGDAPDDAGPRLMFMTSSGGLTDVTRFRGRDAILSGPAGGVVAMAETARAAGFDKVIGFDMGGTSTDVSHYAGAFERTFETTVAGVRLAVPMLRVHTVAAGGGSILHWDSQRFRVGPDSAGARPGPACYRFGGPLTVTDANVVTGKVNPAFFPALFGPNGHEPIDPTAARDGFARIAAEIGDGRSPEDVADGFLRIAVENMANAIKTISVARGFDLTGYALNCFGSAGGQHACQIADVLGLETILIHPLSGLLSAFGIGLAPIRASRVQSVDHPCDVDGLAALAPVMTGLAAAATLEVASAGGAETEITPSRTLHLRYAGSDSTLPIASDEPGAMRRAFESLHRQQFGFASPGTAIRIAAVEIEALSGSERADPVLFDRAGEHQAEPGVPPTATRLYADGHWHAAPIVLREALEPGQMIGGPALVIEPHQTIVVAPDWQLELTVRNDLVLTRSGPAAARQHRGTETDPVFLEVFNNRLAAIAEQMGETLRNTAQSVNIKERLDFSCAIFDADGNLVANAPHVPVHLGSMDRSVASIIRHRGHDLHPGDAYMLNAPYDGGTHLPDITVVSPVFDAAGERVAFYVASRGHHADIGGLAPGSMSPRATHIDEEGVYIDNALLVRDGEFRADDVRALLTGARFPARNPEQNIADLRAQVAANARGIAELQALAAHYGDDVAAAYMGHVQDYAEERMRVLIARLQGGEFLVTADQGFEIRVAITIDRGSRSARIDFSGTSAQQTSNFNAPEPVTRAAVLYVFRVLLGEAIPINAGCLRPVEIVIPDGCLLKPAYPAAVVAGNVEISQMVTNALFAALGELGSAQGTMNNLTFGNARVQYYETLCSGAPAGPDFDGAAGVHVHMTNTRLTDPEILEARYPVVLENFSIRRGSGGRGRTSSGDGTRRVVRFLEPMTAAILSGSRRVAPFGLAGGEPGETGRNLIRRGNGAIEPLAGCADACLEAGDAVIIETPTGGGFGPPKAS